MKEFANFVTLIVGSLVLAIMMAGQARAATTVADLTLKPFKYQPISFMKCQDDPKAVCEEVASQDEWILVRQDGGETCPAGYYYVLNKRLKDVQDIDTQNCDPSVVLDFVKNPLNKTVFIMMSLHGQPAWRFDIH